MKEMNPLSWEIRGMLDCPFCSLFLTEKQHNTERTFLAHRSTSGSFGFLNMLGGFGFSKGYSYVNN